MMRFILTTVLSALALSLASPLLPGYSFGGGLLAALCLAFMSSSTAIVMKGVGRACTLTWRVRTIGRATAILLPIWLLGIWLIPAAELMLVSRFFPATLSFTGWGSALSLAAVLLGINALTNPWSETLKKPCECGH
ncbi:MAG: hypothetical protein K2X27_08260 [Candidatus Obscuribacterales bacterium]|nr:hypothetical protein [Candidatus Obscuribacterales bacterium]